MQLAGGADGVGTPGAVPFSSGTATPHTRLPAGAWDTHFHIFDARFPRVPGAVVDPPEAGVAAYRRLADRLGTRRGVIVQPSTYGTDNACLLDALAQLGAGYRGVAVIEPDLPDTELDRLHAAGVRGVRFNTLRPGPLSLSMLPAMAERIARLGWHVQIHSGATAILAHAAALRAAAVPVVFDHLGGLPAADGVDQPGVRFIEELLRAGTAYVKLSGLYHVTAEGPPAYADTVRIGRFFAEAAPERILFGTDWPHPSPGLHGMPDDARMLDVVAGMAGEAANAMFVDNPERLYGA